MIADVAHGLSVERVEPSSDLDALLFAEAPFFDIPLDEQRWIRDVLVREAFAYHLDRCSEYRSYAERCGFGGAARISLSDIPVYPTSLFKRMTPLSVTEAAIEKWSVSSGTSGTQSRVARDRTSLERLFGSVRAGMPLLGEWYEHEVHVVNLGPERAEAGDIWFNYVMSLIELLHPTTAAMREGELRLSEASDAIRRGLVAGQQVVVVGPPFFVLQLSDYVRDRELHFSGAERVMVVTAGGWKRFGGSEIDRSEFSRRVAGAFAISHRSAIRDAFNQVELNTVFMECEAGWKHVPPWVHAATRDPRTLRPNQPPRSGLLSYLDASATSYPCFIVSDDVGVVREGMCECGRPSVTMRVERRVSGTALRGCAIAMEGAVRGGTSEQSR